jgi:single-stranded DNA-binding protein
MLSRIQTRSYFNKVQLVGRLGQNSTFYPSMNPSQKGLLKFSIVTEHSVYVGNDEFRREQVWHKISLRCTEKKLDKGALVAIDGSIRREGVVLT